MGGPIFRAVYEEGCFRWMDDMAALKEVIASAGFSVKFMETSTSWFEPSEGKII